MPGRGLGASQQADDAEESYHRSFTAGTHGGRGEPVGRGALGRGRGRGSADQDEEAINVAGRGRGRGRGSISLSIGHEASSSAMRGFTTGAADQGAISRGPEVPLPCPNPKIGKPNDINNIWCHGKSTVGAGWACGYCGLERNGGGGTRFKHHLASIGVNVNGCMNAPHHVVAVFRKNLPTEQDQRRRVKEGKLKVVAEINHGSFRGAPIDVRSDDEEEIALQRALRESFAEAQRGRATSSAVGSVKDYFDVDLAYSKTRPQQTIEACVKRVEHSTRIGRAWSKWFHANDIPGHKANCPYFIGAVKLTQDLGKGVTPPKGSDIDGIYLHQNYEELQQYVEKFKVDWPTYGVTIMSDSWTGPSRMSIINFMIFSNGRMYFHKSVNATGHMQDYKFVRDHINEVILEIGEENVVQIVTDNGSNFKKACLKIVRLYPHITWQPCAAHTINLMFKEVGNFPEIELVVNSCKRISRFLYNHSTLHSKMHDAIGGELVRPNATRFGTNFMFLQSYWDKQERFRVWMTSLEWKNSNWNSDPDHDYTYDCLTSRSWWDNLKWVLDVLGPIYTILRFADSQKLASLGGFMSRMMHARHHLSSSFPEDSLDKVKYLEVVDRRVEQLYNNTLMVAAGVLEPAGHYMYKFGNDLSRVKALTAALKKMTAPMEFIKLIPEIDMYINFRGSFGGLYPESASTRVSATQWWITFGDSTPLLQKYALRIVSQCTSSSGCERNWSLFALVHTKVRNRLGFEKLHKLVFCHHNFGMRVREILAETKEKEVDPCAMLMDVSLYDRRNPVMDWLASPVNEPSPTPTPSPTPSLDEDDYGGYDSPCPSVVEVVQKKRRLHIASHGTDDEDEETDGDEEEEEADGEEADEEEEDGEEAYFDQDNNDGMLHVDNQPVIRKSTRKKKKSLVVGLKSQRRSEDLKMAGELHFCWSSIWIATILCVTDSKCVMTNEPFDVICWLVP